MGDCPELFRENQCNLKGQDVWKEGGRGDVTTDEWLERGNTADIEDGGKRPQGKEMDVLQMLSLLQKERKWNFLWNSREAPSPAGIEFCPVRAMSAF